MTDIRMVIKDIGKFEGQLERLITDVARLDRNVTTLATSVDRFKTSIWVVAGCLAIFLPLLGGILWWAVGERINAVLRPPVAITSTAGAPNQQTPKN